MINIKLICVGKLREKFYLGAFDEYVKRLGAYCKFECIELQEFRLPDNPSDSEIANALQKEGADIARQLPQDAYVVAMCVEGRLIPSEGMAKIIRERELSGKPRLCFVIGGSYGMHESIKAKADFKLSMSPMTFPHHLARVMLAEQIYRGFKINEGSKYHK